MRPEHRGEAALRDRVQVTIGAVVRAGLRPALLPQRCVHESRFLFAFFSNKEWTRGIKLGFTLKACCSGQRSSGQRSSRQRSSRMEVRAVNPIKMAEPQLTAQQMMDRERLEAATMLVRQAHRQLTLVSRFEGLDRCVDASRLIAFLLDETLPGAAMERGLATRADPG